MIVWLPMLSVAQFVWSWSVEWLMNSELERVWEEAVTAWLQELRSAALRVHFRFPEDSSFASAWDVDHTSLTITDPNENCHRLRCDARRSGTFTGVSHERTASIFRLKATHCHVPQFSHSPRSLSPSNRSPRNTSASPLENLTPKYVTLKCLRPFMSMCSHCRLKVALMSAADMEMC